MELRKIACVLIVLLPFVLGSCFGKKDPVVQEQPPTGELTEETWPADEPDTTASQGEWYTVQKGDTLYGIARRKYGDQGKWKMIYEANRERISSPGKLKIGTSILLPNL